MKIEELSGPPVLTQRTKDFALRIIRMYSTLPKTSVAQVLGKQILRSGTSVGANYHEANRARSKAEFIAKMGDSLMELEETGYWLELLSESGTIRPARLDDLQKECRQLVAIYITIIKRAKSSSKR
jgi:four helix bundle protein